MHQGLWKSGVNWNIPFIATTMPDHTSTPQKSIGIAGHAIKIACSNCNLRELCMPLGLSDAELVKIDEVVAVRRRVKLIVELDDRRDGTEALSEDQARSLGTVVGSSEPIAKLLEVMFCNSACVSVRSPVALPSPIVSSAAD